MVTKHTQKKRHKHSIASRPLNSAKALLLNPASASLNASSATRQSWSGRTERRCSTVKYQLRFSPEICLPEHSRSQRFSCVLETYNLIFQFPPSRSNPLRRGKKARAYGTQFANGSFSALVSRPLDIHLVSSIHLLSPDCALCPCPAQQPARTQQDRGHEARSHLPPAIVNVIVIHHMPSREAI